MWAVGFRDHATDNQLFDESWKWKSLSCVPLFATPSTIDSPWNSPGRNTGVGSHSLLQGIFPTQGSNSGLPHCRWILYQMSHQGNPCSLMSPIKSLLLFREVLDYFLNGSGPVDVSDTDLHSSRVKTLQLQLPLQHPLPLFWRISKMKL